MTPLLDYLTRLRERLFGKRRTQFRLCPFHQEKTPSLLVSDSYYLCLGCGASGKSADLPAPANETIRK